MKPSDRYVMCSVCHTLIDRAAESAYSTDKGKTWKHNKCEQPPWLTDNAKEESKQ